jgi:hypothetical protein
MASHKVSLLNCILEWLTATVGPCYSFGTDFKENTASSVVASVSVATEMCLPCHYLAVTTSAHSSIVAISCHVIVYIPWSLWTDAGMVLHTRPQLLPSTSFSSHRLQIILSFLAAPPLFTPTVWGMVAAFVPDFFVVFSMLPWWIGVTSCEHYPRKVGISKISI